MAQVAAKMDHIIQDKKERKLSAFRDLEEDLKDAATASVILSETLSRTFTVHAKKDGAGFHVFRLNDEQLNALHYLGWQVRKHLQGAMATYEAAEEPEAALRAN